MMACVVVGWVGGYAGGVPDAMHKTGERGGLPPVLRRFALYVGVLVLISAGFTLLMIHTRGGAAYRLPVYTRNPDALYHWDFLVFAERFEQFRHAGFWGAFGYPFTYPALTAVIFGLFYELPQPVWTYLGVCLAGAAAGAWLLARGLVRRGMSAWQAVGFAGLVAVSSWPLALMLERANIEGMVALLTAAGLLAFLTRRPYWAALLLGLAGAMKIFPLIFLALLLSGRRFGTFALGLAVALAATWVSLWVLGPSVPEAGRQILAGLSFFEHAWAAHPSLQTLEFDHSLFTWVKIPVLWLGGAAPERAELLALRVYTVAVAIGGLALWFLRIRRLPVLNQVLALSVCAVLLPPVSFDYTLLHLYVGFGCVCLYAAELWRNEEALPSGLGVCCLLFAGALTDLLWATWRVRLAGELRVVFLVGLLMVALRCPWPGWGGLRAPE